MPNSFERISAKELLTSSEREAVSRVRAGKPAQISPPIVIDAAKDEATVYVYDAIGGWWGIDPKTWVPEFNAIKAKTIHLRINSPGGSVFDAETIRTAIAQHPSNVVAHIDGMAASAATSVAIAANEVEMSSGAMWMIHNAWGMAMGGAKEMRDYADLLEKVNGNIRAEYGRKTGQDEAQISEWMDAETWFTAADALERGFVDRIFSAADSEEDDDANNATAFVVPGVNVESGEADRARRERALLLAEIGM
jgi:ATP-dependent Clp protease, protease subunit